MQDCLTNHEPCISRQVDSSWRPTRLLDISSPSAAGLVGPANCRLIDGTEAIPGHGYFTLSHWWGSSDIPRLTTETIAQFRTAIPTASLPRTFVDFIHTARRLETRYIWIDSLCIIQSGDGGADWLQEASVMDLVYKNASCNVSADWADGPQGLFF